MKLVVILSLIGLASAIPVADPEAEPKADPEADPALVYTRGLTTLPYTAYSGYYPRATSLYYPRSYSYSTLGHPYVPASTTAVVYGRKKRSADPEAQPEPEADPEADPHLLLTNAGLTYPYASTYSYPTAYTGYTGYAGTYAYPYTYSYPAATSYTAVIQGRKKRSADPEAFPEADPEADPQLLYSAGVSTLPATVGAAYTYPYVSTYRTYPYTTYPLAYRTYPRTYAYGK